MHFLRVINKMSIFRQQICKNSLLYVTWPGGHVFQEMHLFENCQQNNAALDSLATTVMVLLTGRKDHFYF
jgi:hypothetical protein